MKYHGFSETVFQTSDGKLIVTEDGHDCYRNYCARLGLYGEEQQKLYGSKETLAALIKYRYHITPGKYVRQLGETILFFPTKTGLTGAIAEATWQTEFYYIGPLDGLVSMKILDKTIATATLERFCASFGSYDPNGPLPKNPLLVYQYGRLYLPLYDAVSGCFWLKDISGESWRPPVKTDDLPF